LQTTKHLSSAHPKVQSNKKKVLNLAVFGSKSGSNLTAILCAQKKEKNIHVNVVVTDRKCNCQNIAKTEGIPLIYLSYKSIKEKYLKDCHRVYEDKLLEKLKAFQIDYIVLAGYMRLIKGSILRAFKGRIINVHPSDLTYKVNKKRAYTGANAVELALKDGKRKTRSSVIFIDEGIDTGPIFVAGPWVFYQGKHPVDETSIELHQERQKYLSDHPALIKAINILQSKEVTFVNRKIYIDGKRLSLCGYEM